MEAPDMMSLPIKSESPPPSPVIDPSLQRLDYWSPSQKYSGGDAFTDSVALGTSTPSGLISEMSEEQHSLPVAAGFDSHGVEGTVGEPGVPKARRKGGRKPIYGTAQERRARNCVAQADFRKRRTDYIQELEGENTQLRGENSQLKADVASRDQQIMRLEEENRVLQERFYGRQPPAVYHGNMFLSGDFRQGVSYQAQAGREGDVAPVDRPSVSFQPPPMGTYNSEHFGPPFAPESIGTHSGQLHQNQFNYDPDEQEPWLHF
jgi:hypothetical protein